MASQSTEVAIDSESLTHCSRHFASTAAHTALEQPKRVKWKWPSRRQVGDKCSHLGVRLAVLRLRWSHLGANFVYLGAHNGDTTSALPSHPKIHLQNAVPSTPKHKTPPKRSPQWPCSPNHSRAREKRAPPSRAICL